MIPQKSELAFRYSKIIITSEAYDRLTNTLTAVPMIINWIQDNRLVKMHDMKMHDTGVPLIVIHQTYSHINDINVSTIP